MGLTSHISDAYDVFYSSCVSLSLLLCPTKISLMTSMKMKVLGLGSPLVCAFLRVLKYPLIVLVDCCLN